MKATRNTFDTCMNGKDTNFQAVATYWPGCFTEPTIKQTLYTAFCGGAHKTRRAQATLRDDPLP